MHGSGGGSRKPLLPRGGGSLATGLFRIGEQAELQQSRRTRKLHELVHVAERPAAARLARARRVRGGVLPCPLSCALAASRLRCTCGDVLLLVPCARELPPAALEPQNLPLQTRREASAAGADWWTASGAVPSQDACVDVGTCVKAWLPRGREDTLEDTLDVQRGEPVDRSTAPLRPEKPSHVSGARGSVQARGAALRRYCWHAEQASKASRSARRATRPCPRNPIPLDA